MAVGHNWTYAAHASGLSMPVGFKNGTSGDCDIAFDAVTTAGWYGAR